MVKVTYTSRLGKYGELIDFYNPAKIELESAKSSKVVFVDTQGGETIVLKGEDLTVDKHGVVNGGTIEEIDFNNGNGLSFIKITDIHALAKPIASTLQNHDLDALLNLALKGNDTIIGSSIADTLYSGAGKDKISGGGGEDHIQGGKGNDRLTGGASSDHFIFNPGGDKDTITDFDAVGGNRAQDYIVTNTTEYEILDDGNNTLIDFGNGDTITLLNVKHTDVTTADFMIV